MRSALVFVASLVATFGLPQSLSADAPAILVPRAREDDALNLVNSVYSGGMRVSALSGVTINALMDQTKDGVRRTVATTAHVELTYGEIGNEGFMKLFEAMGAKPGQKYIDLGSGEGKSPMLAWAVGLNATGVEVTIGRWDASCDALQRLESVTKWPNSAADRSSLRMVSQSFLEYDWSDADLVFTNNVEFTSETRRKVYAKALRLKKGAKFATFHPFPPTSDFKMIGTLAINTSWNMGVKWILYEKVTDSRVASVEEDGQQEHAMTNTGIQEAPAKCCGIGGVGC